MTKPSQPSGMMPAYAELQCISNFTFLRGASHPEELAARAASLGYSALALTNECSVAGVVRAHTEAKKVGLPLLIGSQFQLTNEDGSPAFLLVILAQNREGYGNLCEAITLARTRSNKGSYRITPHDFSAPEPYYANLGGMPHCLSGSPKVF